VIGVADAKWGEVGRAFIEPMPNHALTPADILAFVKPRLASFKQPKQVYILDVLPRIGSGKIDKQALKMMEIA